MTLAKTLIDTSNTYLTRFRVVSNVMKIVESHNLNLKNYVDGNKSFIELIEAITVDSSYEIALQSEEIKAYGHTKTSGVFPSYQLVFVTTDGDTLSDINYSLTEFGYKGYVSYAFDNVTYVIGFDNAQSNLKISTISAQYDDSYTDLSRVEVELQQQGSVLTLSGKIEIPQESDLQSEIFELSNKVLSINSSVDLDENVASVYLGLFEEDETIDESVFDGNSFIDKIMEKEFLRYVEQVFDDNITSKKYAIYSVQNNKAIEDITAEDLVFVDTDAEFAYDDFMTFIELNKANVELGIKSLYDFSSLAQPVYLNSAAECFMDKTEGGVTYPELVADTISVVK